MKYSEINISKLKGYQHALAAIELIESDECNYTKKGELSARAKRVLNDIRALLPEMKQALDIEMTNRAKRAREIHTRDDLKNWNEAMISRMSLEGVRNFMSQINRCEALRLKGKRFELCKAANDLYREAARREKALLDELKNCANVVQNESAEKTDIKADDHTKCNVYAYVRVSDSNKQDSSTQRHAISEYATSNSLNVTQWQEFHLSGSKTSTKERGIDDLLSMLKAGDTVLVSDIARLGRDSVHQVLNSITSITTKGAEIHFCYSKTVITPDHQNDIASVFMAMGEAYAAVKFSEERKQKAKTACEIRKKAGLHNGRKKGAVIKSKLDDHAVFIIGELDKGTKKLHILKALHKQGVEVTRMSLYRWIDKRLQGKGINKDFHTAKV